MSRRNVNLFAVTRANRREAANATERLVTEVGGWVDDLNIISTLSIALQCFIPAERGAELGRKLKAIGLRIDPGDLADLDYAGASKLGTTELGVSLSILFVHNEPEPLHTILALPE